MPNRRIQFEFDPEKFVQASAFLVQTCGTISRMKLAKLLFFADKRHLLTYGLPIIGDRYIRMDWGPVPSGGYDLIKHDDRANPEAQAMFDYHLAVDKLNLRLLQPPNLALLSQSDQEALASVARDLGHLTASQLSKLSHREPAWSRAEPNAEMDYRMLFGPSDAAVLEMVEEDQALRDALEEERYENFLESLRA